MPRKTIRRNLAYDTERRLYYAVFRENGRRYVRTYRTLREAAEALEGGAPPGRACTLAQWMTYWLEEVVARDRAESTVYGYRNMASCHILPELGRLRLEELTPLCIQAYLLKKLDSGLSPNTVLKHYVLLSSALRQAVRLDLLPRNPMERVDPPKKLATHYTFYTPEQLRDLFAAVEGTMLEPAVKLAAYLGLRRGELCGLRWKQVDLEAGVISICEVRTEVGGAVVRKAPKTRTSIRRLGIGGLEDLQAVLRRLRPDRPEGEDLVILRPDGRPPKPDQLTQELLRVVRRHQLPPITLHGLRHSFASVANSQGVPMLDISRTLGHSSIAVTGNIYTHLFDETQTQVVTLVGRAIEGARGGVSAGARSSAPGSAPGCPR